MSKFIKTVVIHSEYRENILNVSKKPEKNIYKKKPISMVAYSICVKKMYRLAIIIKINTTALGNIFP